MRNLTRRTFAAGAAMTPLLLGAARAQTADPYSYVDPELALALKKFAGDLDPPNASNLVKLRASDTNYSVSDNPALKPRKIAIPGGDVNVLIFDPRPGTKNRPATLYIHGGGYVVGHADTNLRMAQDAAEATGSPVVSVDYTLAPEAHFPKSLEQNYAALTWLYKNAAQFGVDPGRIAVMGDSAGGGHAAMLAIAARDRKQIPLAYQCLIYPMLDDRTGSIVHPPFPVGHFVWTEAANRFGWTSLLGMPAGSAKAPPGSVPARVADVRGLPPTFIGVGSIDLFCPEDMDYARRLVEAGVSTELFVVPGAYHGFDVVSRDAKVSVEFRGRWQNALKRGLGVA